MRATTHSPSLSPTTAAAGPTRFVPPTLRQAPKSPSSSTRLVAHSAPSSPTAYSAVRPPDRLTAAGSVGKKPPSDTASAVLSPRSTSLFWAPAKTSSGRSGFSTPCGTPFTAVFATTFWLKPVPLAFSVSFTSWPELLTRYCTSRPFAVSATELGVFCAWTTAGRGVTT